MTEARPWLLVLLALAGVFLAACEGDDSAPGGPSWQPPAGTGGGTAGAFGSTTGGGLVTGMPGSALPGTTGGGPLTPGPMPFPPDAGAVFMSTQADASVGPRPDASTPTPTADGGPPSLASCTPPPAGSSATAIAAWTKLNEIRLAGGAGCINMVPTLNASAQAHCDYTAMNAGNRSCAPDAHTEVNGCAGFTGAGVQDREVKAGYPQRLAYTEVALTYGDKPDVSIPAWLVTPYHRIPMVDPWTTDMGWGGGRGCDVIDFGRGMTRPPAGTISMFPYNGQKDVPPTFNGLESPQPPAPASGWPSSYPISIYAERISVTEHVLMKDGDPTPLPHVFLDARSPGVPGFNSYFTNNAVLYGAAFQANTTYRVKIVGTHAGGALNAEWTFTTGATRSPFGF